MDNIFTRNGVLNGKCLDFLKAYAKDSRWNEGTWKDFVTPKSKMDDQFKFFSPDGYRPVTEEYTIKEWLSFMNPERWQCRFPSYDNLHLNHQNEMREYNRKAWAAQSLMLYTLRQQAILSNSEKAAEIALNAQYSLYRCINSLAEGGRLNTIAYTGNAWEWSVRWNHLKYVPYMIGGLVFHWSSMEWSIHT